MANEVKTNPGAAAAQREVPAIKPASVKIEAGQFRRVVDVRLPAGMTSQDLHDWPEKLWRLVQDDPYKTLRRFDDVRLVAHDETWMIPDAIVTDADPSRVTLDFKRIVQLPNRNATFEDDTYKIYFDGPDGFVVDRKMDGVRLLKGFATVDAAKSEMHRALYPRKVA